MVKLHLRVAGIVLFTSFAAMSGAFASTQDPSVAAFSAEHGQQRTNSGDRGFYAEQPTDDPGFESINDGDRLVSNPAELQTCLTACKAGGATILRYCGTMPTPQLRVMCISASMIGAASCMGFCYARFVD